MQSNVAIFYKVYAGDYEWLKLSLRSVVKFATGFDSVVVVSDNGEGMPPIGNIEKHFYVTVKGNPYCFQQISKLNADAYTEARFIMYNDADTCITKPMNAQDLIIGGLPVWLLEKYDGMSNPDVLARREEISKFVGQPVEHEFMRRHPFIVERDALVELRRFCWRRHGCAIEDYMSGMKSPSEFNALGAYQYYYRRDSVAWRLPDEMPTWVRQEWSHGGLTPNIKNELEAMLR